MTLTEFLLARIAEDKAVAERSRGPKWMRGVKRSGSPGRWQGIEAELVALPKADLWNSIGAIAEDEVIASSASGRDADHIARWDPARVLAECEFKRRTVDLHQEDGDWNKPQGFIGFRSSETLRQMALPYADHPDYDDAWRP